MEEKSFPVIHTEGELLIFLNAFEKEMQEKHEAISKLEYTQLLEKQINPEIAKLQREMTALVGNPAFESLIREWDGRVADTSLQRRLTLWLKNLTQGKVRHHPEIMRLQRELNDTMVTYPYRLRGDESDLGTLKDILRTSPDPELRKDAWLAKHAMSEAIAPKLAELIRLRNQVAAAAGYATYGDLIFGLDGMDFAEVKELLVNLTRDSDPVYHQILEDGKALIGLERIEPWDLMYLLETIGGVDTALFPKSGIRGALQNWAKAHGSDLSALGIEIVYTDIPYNGLCFTLREGEIRILGNPSDGHGSYRTMFHELGHAFHSAYNKQNYRTFRQESGLFSEGMAEVFGYIPRHINWLKEMGFSETEALAVQKRLVAPWFHYLRERTAYALAEYEIYENPSTDPDLILARMESKVLGVTQDQTPRWAANAWYISYPIYWQNYVLADILASQVHHKLRNQFGDLHGSIEAFAEVQKAYIVPGNTLDWQQRLLNHTGSKLKADALVEDLQIYLKA